MSISSSVRRRLYLSPPNMSELERSALIASFESGWVAPVGPDLNRFEEAFAQRVGCTHAVAVSSGTSALHLALLVSGVQPGDEVLTSSLTFVATANAVAYAGAVPVFIDSELPSWNMCPALLEQAVVKRRSLGKRVTAVMAVDVMGICCDYEPIRRICNEHGLVLIEDAAEALGSTYQGKSAGTLGDIGCFSFNGNKIITTSGGGMVVTSRESWAKKIKHLATQAREPALHYEHQERGYNYRMSNLLAAIGHAQLMRLDQIIQSKREVFARYHSELSGSPGVDFIEGYPDCDSNCWMSCMTVEPSQLGCSRSDLIAALEEQNIESRPVWKPMHLQPLYRHFPAFGGSVSEKLYYNGLCLPSGSNLTAEDQHRVLDTIHSIFDTSSDDNLQGSAKVVAR